MIQSFVVTNHLGESITLELARPEFSGLAVRGVDGLGPSKATVSVSEMAGLDGGIFRSSRKGVRNIVFDLAYFRIPSQNFYKSIEYSRLQAYRYFPPKHYIEIVINTDTRSVRTVGYVENNDPSIFSQPSGAMVSVLCPDPNLYSIEEEIFNFSLISPLFEFPFEIEPPSNEVEFSSISTQTEENVIYNGDSEVGFTMYIHASGAVTGLSITDSESLDSIAIDDTKLAAIVGSGISSGDVIIINTKRGEKGAYLLRGSTLYNIVNALGTYPKWFSLSPGDNRFSYNAVTGLSSLTFEIRYFLAYQGA